MSRAPKRPHEMEIYEAILLLRTPEECFKFFKDVCSDHEMRSMEQRYHVAKMLDEGRTYLDIQEETKASTATISRVSRVFEDGTGVIDDILSKIKREKKL